METLLKSIAVTLLTIMSLGSAKAQDNSVGTSWSMSGIGIVYNRDVSPNTFASVGVRMEMLDTFIGREGVPGASATFMWNTVFKEIESANGIPVRFFAGPGMTIGFGNDFMAGPGVFFGLKGNIGLQLRFPRNVDISLKIAPTLGLHVSKSEEIKMMRLYRNGIIQIIIPEIGISYRF